MTHDIQPRRPTGAYASTGAFLRSSAEQPVDVLFITEKLQKQLSSQRDLQRKWGEPGAKRITLRLQQLAAAVTLEDMRQLPGRCHELVGDRDGELAVDVHQGHRLIFRPTEEPPPEKDDGGLDWSQVESITVTEIVDYH
ncbi:MAG: hypothetical protein JJLCMIEE_03161 [Acidimicrobiales bacterium]|nr:hypothetical protein [Acidimicrobiales bacterium]